MANLPETEILGYKTGIHRPRGGIEFSVRNGGGPQKMTSAAFRAAVMNKELTGPFASLAVKALDSGVASKPSGWFLSA